MSFFQKKKRKRIGVFVCVCWYLIFLNFNYYKKRYQNIVDINMFLGSYVRKEALHSSQIEGTQATLEDILDVNNKDVLEFSG